MMKRLLQQWRALWFEPASRSSFVAARVIVALYALWLVLSRPMLWSVSSWPAPIIPWRHPELLYRFGLFLLPVSLERMLYYLLMLLLVCVVAGIGARAACLVSALLLYHFGPLEEFFSGIFSNGHSGYPFAILSLIVLAIPRHDAIGSSEDYRWPVVMIQWFVALQYVLGGLSKVRFTGITWYNGPNISRTAEEMATLTGAPWGPVVAHSGTLSWGVALATPLLEYLFPLAVVSRKARWFLIPAALAAQVVRLRVYGLYLIGWPLIALFVNWEWVLEHLSVKAVQVPTPAVE